MKEQDGINLIEEVISDNNLWNAYKRVYANKGAPGVDGITIYELEKHMRKYYEPLKQKLKHGTYQPQPVKRVAIPKPDGSKRYLGIPCDIDRVVQQAILQIIEQIINPHFSENSYGFRNGRNTHQAIKKEKEYTQEGNNVI